MSKLFVLAFVISGLLSFVAQTPVGALGLKIAPLEYKTTLKEGERQQGFVDVSNPSSQAVTVRTSVQAFKQINDEGGLQFYDDKQVQVGIPVELETVELGPREAARVAFTIDGNVLPEGDVFAAIFFTTEPMQPRNGVGQLVRVGTILSITNKTPSVRQAEMTKLSLPFFQLSDTVSGTYSVKNTGPSTSGFYPVVAVSMRPGGKSAQNESSLVFGGRERDNDFEHKVGYGAHVIEVGYGDSKKSQLVVTIAPWMIIVLLLIILVVGVEFLLLKKRRKSAVKK